MPIQVYVCKDDGPQDVFLRTYKIPKVLPCGKCGKRAKYVFSAPGVVNIRRGWDEKANEYQRNYYTQARAQINNIRREEAERSGDTIEKVSPKEMERAIQVGAKALKEQKRLKPSAIKRQINSIRRQINK